MFRLTFILFFPMTLDVNAQDNDIINQIDGVVIEDKPVYIDGDYVGQIIVTDVTEQSANSMAPFALQDKTYSESFYGLTANIGYKVDIFNGVIRRAYGLWHWGIIWNTEPNAVTWSSYYSEVTGKTSFGVKDFGFNTTFTLYGYIGVDDNFHTGIQAP